MTEPPYDPTGEQLARIILAAQRRGAEVRVSEAGASQWRGAGIQPEAIGLTVKDSTPAESGAVLVCAEAAPGETLVLPITEAHCACGKRLKLMAKNAHVQTKLCGPCAVALAETRE